MSPPIDNPKKRSVPPDDLATAHAAERPTEPALPDFLQRRVQAALAKRVSAADEPPPPPLLPMLSGIFTFPFYLGTLGAWIGISFGLMVTAWLLMLCIERSPMGMLSARTFGVATCAAGLLTIGYAFSCCLVIMEETSHGWDAVEVSAGIEWKEWVWNFGHLAALVLQAGIVGGVVNLAGRSDSWLVMIWGTLAAFPVVMLGALAAGGAWAPLAIGTVLRSLVRHAWAWGFFYLETTTIIVAWVALTKKGLEEAPWLVPLYAAPLLAAVILIYARLAGRLAACIGAKEDLTKGDDDEDSDLHTWVAAVTAGTALVLSGCSGPAVIPTTFETYKAVERLVRDRAPDRLESTRRRKQRLCLGQVYFRNRGGAGRDQCCRFAHRRHSQGTGSRTSGRRPRGGPARRASPQDGEGGFRRRDGRQRGRTVAGADRVRRFAQVGVHRPAQLRRLAARLPRHGAQPRPPHPHRLPMFRAAVAGARSPPSTR